VTNKTPGTVRTAQKALGLAARPSTISPFRRACSAAWCRVSRSPLRGQCARHRRKKPFGRDLDSAQAALDATLHEVFSEQSIFRIDHYLGRGRVLALGNTAGSARLATVVIECGDRLLREHLMQSGVEHLRAVEISAEGFFDDDAAHCSRSPDFGEDLHHAAEQARRNGEIAGSERGGKPRRFLSCAYVPGSASRHPRRL